MPSTVTYEANPENFLPTSCKSSLFVGSDWVTHDGVSLDVQETKSSIIIVSKTIHDILSDRHWIDHSLDHSRERCHMRYRRIQTSRVEVFTEFSSLHALKVGHRFFLSRSVGPIGALEAFKECINQGPFSESTRKKRWFELVMPGDILVDFIKGLCTINACGGYASCNVSRATGSWYMVFNVIILGPPEAPPSPTRDSNNLFEYHKKSPNQARKTGMMVNGGFLTYDIDDQLYATITMPTSWGEGGFPYCTQSSSFEVPCRTTGHKVIIATGEIQEVKECHTLERSRPLFEWTPSQTQRTESSSKSKKCATIEKVYEAGGDRWHRNIFSILGAQVYDNIDSRYVRLLPAMKKELDKAVGACRQSKNRTDPFTLS